MQWVVGRGGHTYSVNIPRLSPYNDAFMGAVISWSCALRVELCALAPKTTSPNQQIAMNYVCSEANSDTLHLTFD